MTEALLTAAALLHGQELPGLWLVITERNVYPRAAEVFRTSEEDLKRGLAQLGRALGGRWRAEEKTASLAAWVALAER